MTTSDILEIPSYIFCILTMDHLGRKFVVVACMLVGGIFTIICAFVQEGGLRTILALVGEVT